MTLGLFLFTVGYVLVWSAVKGESPLEIVKDAVRGTLEGGSSVYDPTHGGTAPTAGKRGNLTMARGVDVGPSSIWNRAEAAASRSPGRYIVTSWRRSTDKGSAHENGEAVDVKRLNDDGSVNPGGGCGILAANMVAEGAQVIYPDPDSDGSGYHLHAEWNHGEAGMVDP